MIRFIPITLLFLSLTAFADSKPYNFRVVESGDKTPLANAFVRVVNLTENKTTLASSNDSGFVALNLEIKNKYRIDVSKSQSERGARFINCSFFLSEYEIKNHTVKEVALELVRINSQVKLSNMYFEFERTELNGNDKIVLSNTLIALKNSPSLIVEIGIHSDCKEADEVSAKRVEAIQQYFSNKGDLAKRVQIKDYGKTNQLAGCNCSSPVNWSDEVYGQNRVAEFKVLNF